MAVVDDSRSVLVLSKGHLLYPVQLVIAQVRARHVLNELERGLKHDGALARRYIAWLAKHGDDAPKARRELPAL
ncbi:MAG: hypothetical protein M1134_01965 [Actinobacteria bacterium]|nr:hypothetical protein [Actinomycetota bacterium]